MEQIKTIEELRELHGEELREYLVSLPATERQRLSNELLKAKAEEAEGPVDNLTGTTP